MPKTEFLNILQNFDPNGTRVLSWGKTPLHYQCMKRNNEENITICIFYMQNVYAKDDAGKTAYDYAKESGYSEEILSLLLGE